ncbi:adenosylcobinamide-GDP ribazoletransferase [Lysinibacillus telephonicus]|uniref:Adenosylcobinamide-GDP ribazoletransferase n=1 Tax=Lysinibacillus telephonicus TaxID=1714840 RepID=A0A3S0HG19_9BACI|nr:adenosylcobinamide-GDP ribazoletransferase [Lysinibacillus telephonicus]RTQ89451.1 adenosylcobinamide-GDP ribazoletransferase [Lysinibacillus telephonicus]
MKNSLNGLLLSFQFFTSLPIQKQLPMNKKSVTAMYVTMPILGLLMGSTIAIIIFINEHFLQFSSLLLAVCIVVANIVMTGGLHLDGWMDMGDAYFSYQAKERRLEILEDSRIGAFGAISLVVLVLLKIAFIYEVLNKLESVSYLFFICIPFLSRIAVLIYFLSTGPVKEKGLAAYFKAQVIHRRVWISIAIYILLLILASYFFSTSCLLILFGAMLFFIYLYRQWTNRNFGGMTGDLIGALYEGAELFLWGILLLCI